MTNRDSRNRNTLHLVIHGRVQGVFFRNTMQREARNLGISGWVRNRSDGTVEAMVQGDAASLEAMVRWARRGPERAHVEHVDIEDGAGDFTDFEVAS